MTTTTQNNTIIDGVVAAGALTLPWWAELLGAWTALAVTIASFVLVIYRIVIAHREWKRGR